MKELLQRILKKHTDLKIMILIAIGCYLGAWAKLELIHTIIRDYIGTTQSLYILLTIILILSYFPLRYITTKTWIKIYMFGVYWDNNANPRCPTCKELTTNRPKDKDCDLYCSKCKNSIRLRRENHSNISIPEAQQIVKEKLNIS